MHWLMDLSHSYEMIEYAYEITVNRTQQAKLPYINKILENWYADGHKTPRGREKRRKQKRSRRALQL